MIELTHSNYNKYIPINIIAFSYAHSGAQGEPGGVKIIDKDGTIFHFNYYLKDDLKENEINEICPMIKNIESNRTLSEWTDLNMGMGNILFVNNSISQEVKEKTKHLESRSSLYRRWTSIILDIIKK